MSSVASPTVTQPTRISVLRVISYAGAFIALLIGSGFATGQELLQYFASRGYIGLAGVAVTFIALTYAGVSFTSAGARKKFENPNDIYRHYCGRYVGAFYDYFSVFFLFLSFSVMVAGAGATFEEQYGIPSIWGSVVLVILAVATTVFGLARLVNVIGTIGPVIVVMAVVVGTIAIFQHLDAAGDAEALMQQAVAAGQVKVASSNWLLGAGSYVGFSMLWLAAFLARVGAQANSPAEARISAVAGAGGFSLATALMSLGILLAVATVAGSQIPSLRLAGAISPWLATAFSLIIFAGIYTTAVPLLWTVVARFSKEATVKFRGLAVVLGLVGGVVGVLMRFDTLVNYVYVLNGYVGMLLLAIMIGRSIQWRRI